MHLRLNKHSLKIPLNYRSTGEEEEEMSDLEKVDIIMNTDSGMLL